MSIQPSSNNKNLSNEIIKIVEPTEVSQRMTLGDTFIINVVTVWCPDCTVRQKQHIRSFAYKLHQHGIDVLQVNVQLVKGEFISAEHEQLTNKFGGHGYPRTVFIKQGNVLDQNNVEIITQESLSALATKFIQMNTHA